MGPLDFISRSVPSASSLATALFGGKVSADNQAAANQTNIELMDKANAASAVEAQKNRDWQEYMSNTAYQRKMADIEKTGLNPWLALQGPGAEVGTGGVASQSASKVASLGDMGLSQVASIFKSMAFMEVMRSNSNDANTAKIVSSLFGGSVTPDKHSTIDHNHHYFWHK